MGSSSRGPAPLQARRPCRGGPPTAVQEGDAELGSRGRAAEGWGVSLGTLGISVSSAVRAGTATLGPADGGQRPLTARRVCRSFSRSVRMRCCSARSARRFSCGEDRKAAVTRDGPQPPERARRPSPRPLSARRPRPRRCGRHSAQGDGGQALWSRSGAGRRG